MVKILMLALCGILLFVSTTRAQTSTPISACAYAINTSGNYAVTADLNFAGGASGCIMVNVGDVTIDLGGHTLTGTGTGYGIVNSLIQQNVVIENGTIAGFGNGIVVASNGVILSQLHILNNIGDGLYTPGTDVFIEDVESSGNGGRGYFLDGHTFIVRSRFNDNGGLGVDFHNGSAQIIDSDVSDNVTVGIIGTGKVVHTTVKGNGSDGVDLSNVSGEISLIIDSDISHNTGIGVNLTCPAIIINSTTQRNIGGNLVTSGQGCLTNNNVTVP